MGSMMIVELEYVHMYLMMMEENRTHVKTMCEYSLTNTFGGGRKSSSDFCEDSEVCFKISGGGSNSEK